MSSEEWARCCTPIPSERRERGTRNRSPRECHWPPRPPPFPAPRSRRLPSPHPYRIVSVPPPPPFATVSPLGTLAPVAAGCLCNGPCRRRRGGGGGGGHSDRGFGAQRSSDTPRIFLHADAKASQLTIVFCINSNLILNSLPDAITRIS